MASALALALSNGHVMVKLHGCQIIYINNKHEDRGRLEYHNPFCVYTPRNLRV